MNRTHSIIFASVVAVAAAMAMPAQAQLLGSGGLVDVSSGAPSGDATVSVGLGGGDGNVAGVSVGGGGSGSEAVNVGVSGGNDGVGLGGGVLGNNVSVGAGGNGVGAGIGGGANGANSSGGAAVAGTGGSILFGNGGAGGGGATVAVNRAACKTTNVKQIAQLVRSTRFESWKRVSNVQLQRVPMCRDIAKRVRSELQASKLGRQLQAAVQSDTLVRESLSRTRYGADDVLAVRRNGSSLVIYVY